MKTFILSLLLLSQCWIWSGCGGAEEFKKEISTIDSIQHQLDSAEKIFLTLDSAAIIEAMNEVNAKLGRMNELIKDTLNKPEAMLLSQYRSVKKPFREFKQKYSGTRKEIGITRKQLSDLRHDLLKGIMKKEDADLYFNKETALAIMLIKSLQLTNETIPMFVERFKTLNPRIDSLVQVKEQSNLPKTGK